MSGLTLRVALAGGITLLAARTAGAEPPAEALPLPRAVGGVLVAPPTALPPPSHLYGPQCREDRYAVWSLYGVDRSGYFRPRVVLAPAGAYYLYNGEPYPWALTRPMDWMPHVVD